MLNDTDTLLRDTLAKARELMNSHGLQDWGIGYDNAVRRYGQCRHHDKTITISRKLTAVNPWMNTQDTILHEIAHALTPGTGHGREWQRVAKDIGCDGKRTYGGNVIQPPMPWTATCQICKTTAHKARRPSHSIACGACCRMYNSGVFDSRYAFEWVRSN